MTYRDAAAGSGAPIDATVVDARPKRVAPSIVTAAGATTALGVLEHALGGGYDTGIHLLGLAYFACAIGPLIAFAPAPKRVLAVAGDGLLVVGRETIRASEAPSVSVAETFADGAAMNVAVGRGASAIFLDVPTEEDARKIVGALGATWPGRGQIVYARRVAALGVGQIAVATLGAPLALFYGAAPWFDASDKDYAVPALFFAGLAALLHVVAQLTGTRTTWTVGEPLRPGAADLRKTAADARALLHLTRAVDLPNARD